MGQKKKKSRSKSNKHSSPAHSPENKLKGPARTNAKASREVASTGNGAASQAVQSTKGEENKFGPPPNVKTTDKIVPELKSANNNSTEVPIKKVSSEANSPEGKEGTKTPPPAQTGFNFLLSLLGQQQKGPPAEEEAGVSETPISGEEDESTDGREVPDVVAAADANARQENEMELQAAEQPEAEQPEAGGEEELSTDFVERSSPQPVADNPSGAESIEEVSDASLNNISVTTASGMPSLPAANTMEVAASSVSEERTPSHNQEEEERRDDIPSTAGPELGGDDLDATPEKGGETDYVAEARDGVVPPSEEGSGTAAKDQGAAQEMDIAEDEHEAGSSEEQQESESSTARATSWLYGGHHAAGYGVEEPQTEIRGSSFLGAMRNSVAEGPPPPPPRNAWGGYDEWSDPAQAYGNEGAYGDEADESSFEDRERNDTASPWAAMKTEEAKPVVVEDKAESSAKQGVPLPEPAKTVTGSNGPVKTNPRKPAPRVSWDMPIERFHERVNGSVDHVPATKERRASSPAEPVEKKVGLAEVVETIESNSIPEPVAAKATDPVQDGSSHEGVDHTAKVPAERPLKNNSADKDRTAVLAHEIQSRSVLDQSPTAVVPAPKVADDKNALSEVQRKNPAVSNSAPKQVVPVKRPKSSVAPAKKSKKSSHKKVSFADPAEEADQLEFSQAGSAMNERELKRILRMVDDEEPSESDMEALVGMENSLRAALKRQRDLGDAAAAKDDLIETLREQLEIASNRYDSMSEKVTRTESELKSRAEAMAQMQNQLKENAAELSKAKRGAIISKEEYTSLQQNVKRRGETVAELERDIEVKEALLKSMRLDLSMLQKQNGEVETRLNSRETEKGRLQSELSAERQEVKRLGGILENFSEMKATIEASQRESWRTDPQLEARLREAQKMNAALRWELKVLRFQMQAAPTSRRRESMLQKTPTVQLPYTWSTEELENLQRLKARQPNPGSTAKESGLEEPFVSHSEMSRRCFPGDSAKYLDAFSKLYRAKTIEDKLIDDLKGACMAINPVDWERIYLSFFMALESMGKQPSSGEREKLDAMWYQKPWQSVIADDLSKCTETTFKNWTARIWGLGFRNILLWGEPEESLVEQLTQSGFNLCVEGTSVASMSQDSPLSKLAMEGDDFARSVLFENTQGSDQWSEGHTAGAFLSTTGRKCFDLNMSTFGAWQQSFSSLVEGLRSGKIMGKCISLGSLKFGSGDRTAAAPECEALCFLLGTLAAKKGAIIVADLPVSLHSESLKWKSMGNVLILSRLLQVQIFNSVMGGNVHPLLQCLGELSRARIPWITGLEVPLVESKDILRNEGFVNRLTFGDRTKFAAIVEGAEEKNACAAFLTMLVAGIPMMQSGSDITREAKFVQSRINWEKEVGFGNSDELLNLFRVDFSAAAEEQSEPVKKIVGDLNVAVKNIYESSEAFRFVNVSVQEVGEDQSMICFVRTMPQASTEPIPVVVLVNTSNRPVSGRIEASDMLVKLQVPNVAFKLDHLCEPTEGAKFDTSFGVLAAELPPYAISCFRLRVAQTPQRTKMMISSTLSAPELANTVPVLFDWNEGGNSAVVTGSFLNWKQVIALFPVKSNPRRHVGLLYVRPGTYEAKFISDGVWVCSPGLPLTNPSLTPADPSANNQLVVDTPKHDKEVVELHNHFMAVSRARRLPVEMGDMPCLRPVVIAWTKGGSSVSMSASFSGWNDVYKLFAHEAGRYHWTIINFPIGSHYYRFYVDGQWTVAEEHPIQVDDKGIRSNFIQIS